MCLLGESVPIAKERNNFNKILLDAVDDGIDFLDAKGKAAMYYQVEKRFELKREEIPKRLEVFSEALDGLFGYGAKVIEFQIARNLCDKLGLEFEDKEDWTLRDYAEHLGKKWQQTHKAHALLSSVTPLLVVLSGKLLSSILFMKLLPTCPTNPIDTLRLPAATQL